MIDITAVRERVRDHSIVHGVERTDRGHLRIETGFLYPEGSSVDLFLPSDDMMTDDGPGGVRLSDLGHGAHDRGRDQESTPSWDLVG